MQGSKQMQTEEQRNITEAEEMEKIDLVSWLQDYLSCLKKFWLQFLLIFVIVAGIVVSYFEFTYEMPQAADLHFHNHSLILLQKRNWIHPYCLKQLKILQILPHPPLKEDPF